MNARPESTRDELLSDEELIRRAESNPEVQARAEAVIERIKAGEFRDEPGMRGEELSDFLRELRRNVER